MRAGGLCALAALAGASFALAGPPSNLTPLAWASLAGLAFVLDGPRAGATGSKRLEGAARGLAFGVGANVALLRFVPRVIARFTPLPFSVGVVALVLLALAQGLAWGAGGVVRGLLVRAQVPRPVAFALATYAATFVPAIFPWTAAGALAPWPAMGQLAEHIGARGVTALVSLSAGLLATAGRAAFDRQVPASDSGVGTGRTLLVCTALGFAIPGAMALHGRARMRAIDSLRAQAPTASIGLVDPVIPATTRWTPAAAPGILADLTRLTAGAESRGAELTVWPESAYPYILPRGSRAAPSGSERLVTSGVRGPLLVGAVTRDAREDRYNAALAVRPDGAIAAEYDKLHLLWFGEEVPFTTELPWLRRTFARGLGLLPGDRPVLVTLGRVRIAPLICFEDILPEAGREAASVAPNLLVNLTNDAWFSGSAEAEMHLWLASMRAIETRRDLVRAVNLGPTGLVDAAGRIREASDTPFPSSLVVEAALLDGPPTIYARFGDWPWIVAGLLVTLVFRRTAKRTRTPTNANERRSTEVVRRSS